MSRSDAQPKLINLSLFLWNNIINENNIIPFDEGLFIFKISSRKEQKIIKQPHVVVKFKLHYLIDSNLPNLAQQVIMDAKVFGPKTTKSLSQQVSDYIISCFSFRPMARFGFDPSRPTVVFVAKVLVDGNIEESTIDKNIHDDDISPHRRGFDLYDDLTTDDGGWQLLYGVDDDDDDDDGDVPLNVMGDFRERLLLGILGNDIDNDNDMFLLRNDMPLYHDDIHINPILANNYDFEDTHSDYTYDFHDDQDVNGLFGHVPDVIHDDGYGFYRNQHYIELAQEYYRHRILDETERQYRERAILNFIMVDNNVMEYSELEDVDDKNDDEKDVDDKNDDEKDLDDKNEGEINHVLSILRSLHQHKHITFPMVMVGENSRAAKRIKLAQDQTRSKSLSKIKPTIELVKGEELSEDSLCSICLEKLSSEEKNIRISHCKHLFHGECIFKWLRKKKSCPNCRLSSLEKVYF
ncbi:hypothetical protein BVRB_012910 [Beta vulgaris subsp. vulgaris]|uniref:RING-type E3 ubiquitin transferase n=1 Tax=Beta vulgaris subsp. vulgaris TaxID=3555 RepID=A0A0J8B1Y8_BETVV|nr:hypothetical protein BVRB_012910 [Beta vulgaris subsp. vulgaris]